MDEVSIPLMAVFLDCVDVAAHSKKRREGGGNGRDAK